MGMMATKFVRCQSTQDLIRILMVAKHVIRSVDSNRSYKMIRAGEMTTGVTDRGHTQSTVPQVTYIHGELTRDGRWAPAVFPDSVEDASS